MYYEYLGIGSVDRFRDGISREGIFVAGVGFNELVLCLDFEILEM